MQRSNTPTLRTAKKRNRECHKIQVKKLFHITVPSLLFCNILETKLIKLYLNFVFLCTDHTTKSWKRERPKIERLILIRYQDTGKEKEFRFLRKILPKLSCAGVLLGVPVNTLAGHLSPEDKAQEMLTRWLQRGSEDYPVEWGSLVQLLLDVELSEEAKELERALEHWYKSAS